jgi:predicted adenylyl cyclase CyaB
MPAARNIELKARLTDPVGARLVAERLATERLGVERQRDTYFHCRDGRLKLREIDGGAAQLIAYQRADRPDAKASDYRLATIADAVTSRELAEILQTALGVLVVVDKTREIFLYQNVRIHLDQVAELGDFIEFEAIVRESFDDAAAHRQVTWLMEQFGIAALDLMHGSYSDMLIACAPSPLASARSQCG